METRRQRRRGGKSAQAVSSDPPVRPPSPTSDSTAESEEESEMELADLGATGVRDRDPPTTALPGDAYETPPAGAGAGAEGAQAEASPSPVGLAQGWLATTGEDLSGPDVEDVDPAALATTEVPDPGVGPLGPQSEGVTSPPRVERSDSIKTTNPHTLDVGTSETQTLDEHTHTQVQVDTRTLTLASRAEPPSLTLIPQTQSLTYIYIVIPEFCCTSYIRR